MKPDDIVYAPLTRQFALIFTAIAMQSGYVSPAHSSTRNNGHFSRLSAPEEVRRRFGHTQKARMF